MADAGVARKVSETFSVQLPAIVPEMFTTAALLVAGAYFALLAGRKANNAFLAPLLPKAFPPMGKSSTEAALHWLSAAMVSFSVCARFGTEFQDVVIELSGVGTDPAYAATLAGVGCALSVLMILLIAVFLAKRGVRRPLLNWGCAVFAMSFGIALLLVAATLMYIGAAIGFLLASCIVVLALVVALTPSLISAALHSK